MKKLLALSLCFVVIFAFASCGEKKAKSKDSVDLSYYANLGKIPEVSYKLGADCENVEKELQAEYDAFLATDPHNSPDHDHDHDVEEIYYNRSDEGDYIFLNNGSKYFLYKKDQAKKGISCIVTFGDAFGFKMGTFIVDVKKAMPNTKFVEEEITEGSVFFEEFLSSGTVLKTQVNGVTIMFVFQEGELYCTAMYKTNSWK